MGKTIKQWYHNGQRGWKITFWTANSIALLLIIISFLIPPMGIIDSSVFAAIGEMAFFPTLYAAVMVIMSGRSASITKGETTLKVEGDKELMCD